MNRQQNKTKTVTNEQSLVLMKNMIRISISSICYHRSLFPNSCFRKREYGSTGPNDLGTSIHTLEPAHEDSDGNVNIHNQDAFLLTQWLEQGVFGALHDQYLKVMTFMICSTHPQTGEDLLLESYDFNVTYSSKKSLSSINGVEITKQSLKAQANKFVRALIEFSSTLDDIPESRWLTVQLEYLDSTPSEYQPMYFADSKDCSPLPLISDNKVISLKIGVLTTPHHNLAVAFTGVENIEALLEIDTPIGVLNSKVRSRPNQKATITSSGSTTGRYVVGKSPDSSPTNTTDEEDISGYKVTAHELVRDYVIREKCSVMRTVASELSIGYDAVKKVFETLVEDGTMKRCNNGHYMIASSTSTPEPTRITTPVTPKKILHKNQRPAISESVLDNSETSEILPVHQCSSIRNLTSLTQEKNASSESGHHSEPILEPKCRTSSQKRTSRELSRRNTLSLSSINTIGESGEAEWSDEDSLPKKKRVKFSVIKDPLYLPGIRSNTQDTTVSSIMGRIDYSQSSQ